MGDWKTRDKIERYLQLIATREGIEFWDPQVFEMFWRLKNEGPGYMYSAVSNRFNNVKTLGRTKVDKLLVPIISGRSWKLVVVSFVWGVRSCTFTPTIYCSSGCTGFRMFGEAIKQIINVSLRTNNIYPREAKSLKGQCPYVSDAESTALCLMVNAEMITRNESLEYDERDLPHLHDQISDQLSEGTLRPLTIYSKMDCHDSSSSLSVRIDSGNETDTDSYQYRCLSIFPDPIYDENSEEETYLYAMKSDDPARPNRYIRPPEIIIYAGGQRSRPPKELFESCPFPGGNTEMNKVLAIKSYCLKGKRLMFLVMFKFAYMVKWIDYSVVKMLEPRHIFVDWLRGVYLYHPYKRTAIWKKARQYGFEDELDTLVGDSCMELRIGSKELGKNVNAKIHVHPCTPEFDARPFSIPA